jgi:hypothetical protein
MFRLGRAPPGGDFAPPCRMDRGAETDDRAASCERASQHLHCRAHFTDGSRSSGAQANLTPVHSLFGQIT